MTTWYRSSIDAIMTPDPREEKLPRWAQDKLAAMRLAVKHSDEVAHDARLSTNPAESSAVLDYYGDVPVGLGKDAEVWFTLPDDRFVSVRVDRKCVNTVEIRGSGPVTIRPHVSNAFTLEVER